MSTISNLGSFRDFFGKNHSNKSKKSGFSSINEAIKKLNYIRLGQPQPKAQPQPTSKYKINTILSSDFVCSLTAGVALKYFAPDYLTLFPVGGLLLKGGTKLILPLFEGSGDVITSTVFEPVRKVASVVKDALIESKSNIAISFLVGGGYIGLTGGVAVGVYNVFAKGENEDAKAITKYVNKKLGSLYGCLCYKKEKVKPKDKSHPLLTGISGSRVPPPKKGVKTFKISTNSSKQKLQK